MTNRPRQTHAAIAQDAAGVERARVLGLHQLARAYGQAVDRVEQWIVRGVSLASASTEMDRELLRPPLPGQPAVRDAADLQDTWAVLLFGRAPERLDGIAGRLMNEAERSRPGRFTQWLLSSGPESHPVELWQNLLRSLPAVELSGSIGASPRANLGRALRDAAMAEINLMIAASPAWRRLCQIAQVPNFRKHRCYLKTAAVVPVEVGESQQPQLADPGDWPNTAADPQITDRYVDVALSVERFLASPSEIGADILAGQQRFVEQLQTEIAAALVRAATEVNGATADTAIDAARVALAGESLGGRRISATGARPIVAVDPTEIDAFRMSAPSASGDQAAAAGDVLTFPAAAAGTRLACSVEFPPALITAFSEQPEQPRIAVELPGAQRLETVDGVERPVYVPSRSPRLTMLWSRSDATTWPNGAGVRALTVS